ncbi:hypothetical protein, partial [Pseudonocardia lacus]|uniref:hypothetical protein n=1 Tax=Pseudonocardia lacus TaxID=2835865 RepID=UPI001BDC6807
MTITGPVSPIGAQDTVVIDDGPGVAFVPAAAPLIGLNYFDGRFLRADDLNLERRGQRTYADLSNQARGTGVVAGFDLTERDGASLSLTPGLAVDPQGRVLHLPVAVPVTVRALLDASGVPVAGATAPSESATAAFAPCEAAAAAPPATTTADGSDLFLVCLAHASGLCGQAEVLGRLCDGGCTTAADRPYVVDGVRLLLRPLDLTLDPGTVAPGVTSEAQLRSRVAAAYFAREFADARTQLSKAGLEGAVWSAGAPASGGDIVPIGVLGWNGSTITFLDTWTARRELIDPAPSRYWAGRVEQRPWSVFLAQVLQFQSHMTTQPPQVPSPALPPRILLERGLVELPPAGYLAVDPDRPDLRGQVQDLVGPGVALRLCAVPRDQVPRELERAQHLERISLLRAAQGRPPEEVDVLVPDGSVVAVPARRTGLGFAVDATVGEPPLDGNTRALPLVGAARVGDGPGVELRLAVGATGSALAPLIVGLVNTILDPSAIGPELTGRRPRPGGPDVGLLRVFAEAAVTEAARRRAGASTT